MSQARKDILNGWKEIAQYISRDIRTVERWEKQRGLPVRRIPGSGRGVVYAHISEVEQWLAGHKTDLAAAPEVRGEAVAAAVEVEQVLPETASDVPPLERTDIPPLAAEPAAFTQPGEDHPAAPRTPARFGSWVVGASLLIALACAGLAVGYRMRVTHGRPGTISASALPREHQHSRVAGVDELYLKGAFAMEQRTPESLAQARTALSTAIAKDESFAPAYASLAETYCLLREYARVPEPEAWSQAEANARKAIALDPQLSDAHAVLGFVDFFWRMDAEDADREFRTAIALDPSSVLAHHWYGSLLTHDGRFTEALQQLDIAQHLNPSSFAILTQRALAIGLSGRRDEADAMLEEMLKENRVVGDHDSSTAHIVLAILSFQAPADLHRALVEYQRSAELRHDAGTVQRQNRLLKALAAEGPRGMWKEQIKIDKEDHPGEVVYSTVQAEAQLGEREQALRDLRQVLAKPNNGLAMLNTDALLDPLREDPGFLSLRSVHAVSLPANGTARRGSVTSQ